LGWMMGPWLIYASLINKATMALFYGVPQDKTFGDFINNAGVTILGVVPALVKGWINSNQMRGMNFPTIKCFSSTGECSNPKDYLYLMSLAGYRPVIEYCGGTEIGGGYISGTLVTPQVPASFSTPTLGLDVIILNQDGNEIVEGEEGELFLVPPSIGLSQTLLNNHHHQVYFEGVPLGPRGELLRRHGDQMKKIGGGYYRGQGRADDTMNLGGIKISSVEIERIINSVDGIKESAAVGHTPKDGGPESLIIYCVLDEEIMPELLGEIKKILQEKIKNELNPLFKINDVVRVDSLPRTASNKLMRRILRDKYSMS
jgi:acetyl-CoA synthetase